jgi:hypothetical protein
LPCETFGKLVERLDDHVLIADTAEAASDRAQGVILFAPILWVQRSASQAQQRPILLDRLSRLVHRLDRVLVDRVGEFDDRGVELFDCAAANCVRDRLFIPKSIRHAISLLVVSLL